MFLNLRNWMKQWQGILALLIIGIPAFSQPTITGPTCTVPGVVYQYILKGSWKASSTMQVCIKGGNFRGKDTTLKSCTPQAGAPLSSLLVVWNNPGVGSLTLNSALGNNILNVTVVSLLQGGTIDSSSKKQVIGYDSIPSMIICSADSGGSCSPVYADQWQQSADMLSWKNIQGATSLNLSVTFPLTQSTFFRRKVIEKTSGTIGYSDVAFVDVGPPPPSALQSNQNQKETESKETAFNNKACMIKTF
jgi:hypothetical protein